MPLHHLYVFCGEMSIQVFCPFFDWVICYFDIEPHELFVNFRYNLLVVTLFANIFSHPLGCLSVFTMVFFVAQKLLSLIRSHNQIFLKPSKKPK